MNLVSQSLPAPLRWAVEGIALVVDIFMTLLYRLISGREPNRIVLPGIASGVVLIVTAHPDDECMFFAPTILALQQQYDVFLLCLSTGDYDGIGSVRRAELVAGCSKLGMPSSRVEILGGRKFADDPYIVWPAAQVASAISEHIQKINAQTLITFDQAGVSGHSNHKAVYAGTMHLIRNGDLPSDFTALCLETTCLARKYSGLLDAPLSSFRACAVLSSKENVRRARQAMLCHASQMVWFRHWYLWLSRYMYINTLKLLHATDA